MMILYCCFILFFVGIFSLIKNREHILILLLSLEMMILSMYFFMNMLFMESMLEMMIFYLILVVCESTLGLSLMIMCIFFYGNEFFNSKIILSC